MLLLTNPKVASTKLIKKPPKENDRWTHDRFNEGDQAPKSRNELVTSYGYDIRNEDCAPRPRRTRKYGRGQPKYSRNWEDEEAYKSTASKVSTRKVPRAEDFPALSATTAQSGRRPERRRNSRQDENEPQDYQQRSDRSERPDRSERSQRNSYSSRNDWNDSNDRPSGRDSGPRDRQRGSGDRDREPRGQLSENRRYNNENSNNNNNRSVNGKRNINYRHNTINSVEFKSQNRKNINSEQTQQRFNNEIPVASASFTNSKMNNANNNPGGSRGDTSRKILTFDNSSTSNYGRSSREKETNQMHNQPTQGGSQMAPNNKNLDHEQVKLVEKSYAQSKSTNVNLNSPSQPIQNDMMALNNSGEAARPKRYSFRQRSNVNEPMIQSQGPPGQQYQQIQQQQEIQNVLSSPPTQQSQNYMQQPPQMAQPAPVPVPQQKYPPTAYYVNQAAPQSDYSQQQVAMAQYQQYQQQQVCIFCNLKDSLT